jgi:hypothetical protein
MYIYIFFLPLFIVADADPSSSVAGSCAAPVVASEFVSTA